MKRAIFMAAVFAGAWVFAPSAQAATRSLRELSVNDRCALEASQQRLGIFDRELAALDLRYARRKIGSRDYGYEKHDLNALIAGEAKFQDDLLTRSPGLSEDTREILENIAKYTVLVPEYAVAIALKASVGHSYSFSP
jgi:hypothetical protein